MSETQRPFSKRELSELRGYVSSSTSVFRIGLFIVGTCIVGWLFSGIQRMVLPQSSNPWWLLPTGGLMLLVYLRSSRWTGGSEKRHAIRQDIARGSAFVRRIEVDSAIEFQEQEDEGPAFVVNTREGQTILFAG